MNINDKIDEILLHTRIICGLYFMMVLMFTYDYLEKNNRMFFLIASLLFLALIANFIVSCFIVKYN